jgi:hypothetical protein
LEPNESRADRLTRAALLGALLIFVAGLALGPMSESDLFFRIQAGREILARHGLPGRNLYSFTYPDHPDIDTSWLFEVGAALLYRLGGFPAVVLAKAAVLAAIFAAAFGVCRRRGASPAAAALALAAAAWAARDRFVERPHVFSLAGVVLVLASIDALAGERAVTDAARARRVALAALGGIVLWANLHAGVFLAPALLALAAAGARLDRAAGAVRLAALAALAGPATLATPAGVGLLTYLRLHTVLPGLHPVDEFRAATWISDAPWFVFAAAALAAAALQPRRWRVLLPMLALGALALRSIRFGADFALLAAPVVAVGLTTLAARLGAAAERRASVGLAALAARLGAAAERRASVGLAALLVVLAAAPRVADAAAGRRAFAVGLDQTALPLDAIRFVEERGLRQRMYNDFEIGSYLLFQGYPRWRVFIDPRLPAYPPELHALLGRADLGRDEWDAALSRYGVDTALLAYAGLNRRVSWFDPARWALVYRANDARVFVRRQPRFRALIAEREIPATFSFTLAEGTATEPLAQPPPGSPVTACEWQRRLGDLLFDVDGPQSPRAPEAYRRALAAPSGCLPRADERRLAAMVAPLDLRAKRPAEALALYDRAVALGDQDATTLFGRAIALEQLGRRLDAAAAWRALAAREGETEIGKRARTRAVQLE